MTTTIDWGDGSGDKITLTYDANSGDQSVSVRSDPNTRTTDRTRTISFTTSVGAVRRSLHVTQKGRREYTLTLHLSAFLSGQYASISGQNNPVGKGSDSSTYVSANLRTGSNAETWLYYAFDTSQIPADAEIVNVTCSAKALINQTNANRITARTMQMYSGTSAKGSAYTLTTTAVAVNLNCGSWTRAELNDCRIRVYVRRGTNSTSTTYYTRLYGATLTITYRA